MTGRSVRELVDPVMDALLSGDQPHLRTLRTQYERGDVTVESTDVGFFAEFETPAAVDAVPVDDRFVVGDVEASMAELEHGMGFVLFVDDGRISMLEGYTYDEAMPATASDLELRYTSGDRDERELSLE